MRANTDQPARRAGLRRVVTRLCLVAIAAATLSGCYYAPYGYGYGYYPRPAYAPGYYRPYY